jgi:hypothetical protein
MKATSKRELEIKLLKFELINVNRELKRYRSRKRYLQKLISSLSVNKT